MLTKRVFLAGAAAVAAGAVMQGAAAEAAYPTRTIRIIVGYAAGGGVDIVARLLGDPMSKAFHQTIIVAWRRQREMAHRERGGAHWRTGAAGRDDMLAACERRAFRPRRHCDRPTSVACVLREN